MQSFSHKMWANSVRKAGERECEDCLLEYRETQHRPLRRTTLNY